MSENQLGPRETYKFEGDDVWVTNYVVEWPKSGGVVVCLTIPMPNAPEEKKSQIAHQLSAYLHESIMEIERVNGLVGGWRFKAIYDEKVPFDEESMWKPGSKESYEVDRDEEGDDSEGDSSGIDTSPF